jgi:predicted SAM-dependent methyltransferase
MTWTLETSQGFESDKIAAIVVPYLQGRFLDIGCGQRTVWPQAIGVDNGHHFGGASAGIHGDGTDLSIFADQSMDAVFSSHTLEHFEREKVPGILAEWTRVLKVGGYLVLYLPSANLYPKCGEDGANPDHKWDIYPGDVEAILKEMEGWEQVEREERGETNEYSLFLVFRRTDGGWSENIWERNPGGRKRALVCRFGAIGDQIVAASILPGLKKQGYHVTYMSTPEARAVVQHDPHIDGWWTQTKDFVPNAQLGPYWDTVKQRFDLFVNLSESVEGTLLALPGRLFHSYSDEARRRIFGRVNYLERTHDIAAVPHEFAARFYPSAEEIQWAADLKRQWGGPIITWAITGSANHKVYPFTQVVIKWLLDKIPATVVLLSDPGPGKEIQDGLIEVLTKSGADMTRVKPMGGGAWTVRQALSFCQVSDMVVGPETGPLNAVCLEPMPKVIYLSHSSATNLTKHWRNTTTLLPDVEQAPCYPCHRLHYDWTHCHMDEETNAALCASSIKPKHIFEAIAQGLGMEKAA